MDLILCPGMARAGTTWLYWQLARLENTDHFNFARAKETEYFTGRTKHSWNWWYPDFSPGRPFVDISPYYLSSWTPWIDNIKAHGFRSVRVVLMLRHPVEQLWSHYLHDLRAHIAQRYLGDEVDFSLWTPKTLYRYCGQRAKAIGRLVSEFGRENVLALNFHRDLRNADLMQEKLSDFLGIPLTGFSPAAQNAGGGMPWYAYGGAHGHEAMIDGKPVHVPAGTVVLVNGDRSAVWPDTPKETAARLMLMASMWTQRLNARHIKRLWAIFMDDWNAVCDQLGCSVADFPRPRTLRVGMADLRGCTASVLISPGGLERSPLTDYAFEVSGGERPAFVSTLG